MDAGGELPDVVLRFRDAVAALVCRFGDELLNHIRDAKGIDVEDVRAALVDPVRPPPPGDA